MKSIELDELTDRSDPIHMSVRISDLNKLPGMALVKRVFGGDLCTQNAHIRVYIDLGVAESPHLHLIRCD